jgi:hypothetical protein
VAGPLKWGDSVVVTNDVYHGEPSTLYCVDAATGALRWRAAQTVIGMSDVGCLAAGVALYYTNKGLSGLNAYDILTGSLAWSRPDVMPGMPRLVAPGKVVICDRPQESAVEALDPLTGRTVWRAPARIRCRGYHVNFTRDTPCLGSVNLTTVCPPVTVTRDGATSRCSRPDASSSAICARDGDCGEPMAFQRVYELL